MLSNNTYINTITKLSIQSRGQNKYLNWYLSIITKAQNRNLTEYTEKHHIVPDCFYITRKRKGIAHKQSSKDLMSKSKKGKKRTTPHSENQIELLIARCQKQYKIYSPNNEILIITNMTKFCKENNLDPSNMFKVANGFKQNYKGWVCEHYIN